MTTCQCAEMAEADRPCLTCEANYVKTDKMSDRPENGPMRFGDDWAGVFLRGDYARPVSMYLNRVADAYQRGEMPDPTAARYVRAVANILSESDERGSLDGLQQLPDFTLCKALPERVAAIEARIATAEEPGGAWGLAEALRILRGET